MCTPPTIRRFSPQWIIYHVKINTFNVDYIRLWWGEKKKKHQQAAWLIGDLEQCISTFSHNEPGCWKGKKALKKKKKKNAARTVMVVKHSWAWRAFCFYWKLLVGVTRRPRDVPVPQVCCPENKQEQWFKMLLKNTYVQLCEIAAFVDYI